MALWLPDPRVAALAVSAGLFLFPFVVYWDAIRLGGYVSDDILGMQQYTGIFQRPLCLGTLVKWLRWQAARRPNPNPRWREEKLPPFLPSAPAHHRLNVWFLGGCGVLLYAWLSRLCPAPIPLWTTLLFLAHPLGTQTVAWISGIGYPIGLFFTLCALNLMWLVADWGWLAHPVGVVGSIGLVGLFQWLAAEMQFSTIGSLAVVLFLQQWPFAIVQAGVSLLQGFHTFREAVALRTGIFKEQQMAASTRLHWRKVFVVAKTFYYNLKLSFFPKRMGLYSPYYYHYPLPQTEAEDPYFWAGMVCLLLVGLGFWAGPFPVRLGLLWFVAYIAIFSGLMIANQFVVDRYVWIPAIGSCLVVATLCTTWHLTWLVWLLLGVALMRTWAHLFTYRDEFYFYHSNLINFPDSEVAWGNLGVAYLQRGMVGSAIEAWLEGTRRNKEYDVCWYNLASVFRQRGPLNPNYAPLVYQLFPTKDLELLFQHDPTRSHLQIARHFLRLAIATKTCHFPDQWKKELEELETTLKQPPGGLPVASGSTATVTSLSTATT